MQPEAKRTKRSRKSRRGSVMVEYALLLTGVAMPMAAGIMAGGAAMLQSYHEERDMLLLPIP